MATLGCMAALGMFLLSASADAAAEKAIWGPATLSGPTACGGADTCSAFPTYARLGVEVFQFQIHWSEVAPSKPADPRNPNDPAYRWPSTIDYIVQQAAANGIDLAALIQLTPPWANGGRSAAWAPNSAQDFGDFAYAVSRRYPTIHTWMIWGEPSFGVNFQPMRQGSPKGPRRYAQVLDAAYAALKNANPQNVVIGGNTLNGGLVKPPEFIRWMRLPNGRPPRLDLYGHNPFDRRFPNLKDRPHKLFRGLNDIDTLHREVNRAYRKLKLRPKLWLSEWTIISDHAATVFPGFFVSREEQARRLSAGYRLAQHLSYVKALGWFTLLDQPPFPGSADWGLLDSSGVPKPAFYAYQQVPK